LIKIAFDRWSCPNHRNHPDPINKVTGRPDPDDLFAGTWSNLIDLTLRDAVNYMYSQKMIDSCGALKALSRIHRATGEPLLFITGHHVPETAQRQLEGAAEPNCSGNDRDERKRGQASLSSREQVDFIVEDDVSTERLPRQELGGTDASALNRNLSYRPRDFKAGKT
jgi:hypothetical protein